MNTIATSDSKVRIPRARRLSPRAPPCRRPPLHLPSPASTNHLVLSYASMRRMSETKDQVRCRHDQLLALLGMRPPQASLRPPQRLRQRRRPYYIRGLHHPRSVPADEYAHAPRRATKRPWHVRPDAQLYREPCRLLFDTLRCLSGPARYKLYHRPRSCYARSFVLRAPAQLSYASHPSFSPFGALPWVAFHRLLPAARFGRSPWHPEAQRSRHW